MDLRRTLAPTVALGALSAAVAAGLTRLLTGDDWLGLALAAAVLPHVLGAVTRTRSAAVQGAVWTGGLAVFLAWAVVPGTTRWGMPTGSTLGELGDRLDAGLTLLREQSAPVPGRPGPVLLAVVALWVMAAAADALAFRRWASIGALAPAITLFIWVAALAPDAPHAARAAGAVAVTGAAFLALQHQVLQTRRRAAVGSTGPVPAPRQVAGGVALAVVAAVVAAALAPSLPGAGADPLVDLRDDDSGSSTYQTSIPPLVDVADNLRRGEQIELFTVDAPAPQYWRTVGLDTYSSVAGGQWTLQASGSDIDRGLDGAVPAGALRQEFRIGPLGERWLPAAFEPVALSLPDALVVRDSSTLVADAPSVAGLAYTVESVPPAATLDEVRRRATGAAIPDDLVVATALPPEVPDSVVDLARTVTAGATTPFDRALALRDFFRDGSFTYDPEVDLDDAIDATVAFLELRRGFCVQFASTYALMARAVGLPARVAVGFTPGTPDPTTGRFRVTNYEAHAWPEVWLPGVGWTHQFEPTPPSEAPGGSDLPGEGAPVAAPTPVTTTPPPAPEPAPGDAPPAEPEPGTGTPTPAGGGDDGPAVPRWVVAVLLVLLAAGALAGFVPARKARRRAARKRRADPAERVAGAWEEAVDRLRELGEPRPVHHTPAEVASRVEPVVGRDAVEPLAHLADAHTAAQFGAAPVTDAAADAAWTDLDAFRRAIAEHVGLRRRVRARLAPLRDRGRPVPKP